MPQELIHRLCTKFEQKIKTLLELQEMFLDLELIFGRNPKGSGCSLPLFLLKEQKRAPLPSLSLL